MNYTIFTRDDKVHSITNIDEVTHTPDGYNFMRAGVIRLFVPHNNMGCYAVDGE